MTLSPREFLQTKGWEYKKTSGEFIVKVCPKCGDGKFHFYMDQQDGVWFCHKCGEKGNIVSLRRDLGDMDRDYRPVYVPPRKKESPVEPSAVEKYHGAFLSSPEAIAYITGRGISLETCKAHRVCFKSGWIGYPSFREGKCVVIKWRSLPPAEKKFMREPSGAESLLFNLDCLKSNPKEVIVTEGEIDALTVFQAGFTNVVSIPNGAGNLPEEAVIALKKVPKVYLAYDPDLSGRKGAEVSAKRVGLAKCFNVSLPTVDINDFFMQGHTAEDFRKLLAGAKPFGEPHILDFDSVYLKRRERLQAGGPEKGLRIGIRPVEELVGTLRPGNVYILSAYPKVGKTTLSINVAWDIARRGIPILFFCLEMTPEEVAETLLMHTNQTEVITDEQWNTGLGIISLSGFRFGWNPSPKGWKATLEVIREAVKDHGIRFLVIDNFHFLTRAEKDVVTQEAIVSMEIKALSVELDIPIWLIVHPRKKDSQTVEERPPTFQDLRGSASIAADASVVLILHRPVVGTNRIEDVEHPRSSLGFLRADASRFTKGGQRKIIFDASCRTFREPTEYEVSVYTPKKPVRRITVNRGPV